MRIRKRLLAAAVIALLGAACTTATEPLMTCDGNPKCKPDTQPTAPSNLRPLPSSPATR